MNPIARHMWAMRCKKHLTLVNLALVTLLAIEILWVWFLWRILNVTLDILYWGGEIP